MDRFDSNSDELHEAGQQAGAYVQQLAGATKQILSDIKL